MSVPLIMLSIVMVSGIALADTSAVEQRSLEVDTADATCAEAAMCDAPSAEARATVKAPSVTADKPQAECFTKVVDSQRSAEECQPSEPSVERGLVSTYVAIHGLDGDSGDSHASQGQQASTGQGSDTGMLGVEAEAAVLLGALGLGASGAAAWFGLRRVMTFLLAPLASRLKRSELLDNATRRAIYEEIQDDPGVNLRGLADRLDLAWGTLLHHLRKLEDGHLIVSDRYGKYRRFFLNGSTYSKEEQARLAALSTPSTARVAEYILDNPGANQSEVGDAIGVTPSTVLFHVRRLKEVGLVQEEREGRYVLYYPNIHDHEAQQMAVA